MGGATKENRMTKLRLYSAKACPFAHRTRLVLHEKAIDYELTEVDLHACPSPSLPLRSRTARQNMGSSVSSPSSTRPWTSRVCGATRACCVTA